MKIGQPFAVGKYEVTFDEWDACVTAGGCKNYGWGGGRRPVNVVSWNDAVAYVDWLAKKTGQRYRLLSEAEWEYAARAGRSTAYPWGNKPERARANFGEPMPEFIRRPTDPAGSFGANAFGLHDMIGNAWEWVQDCYHDSYTGAPADGSPWTAGTCSERVRRGGGWDDGPEEARSANRERDHPATRWGGSLGFRVARTLP